MNYNYNLVVQQFSICWRVMRMFALKANKKLVNNARLEL